MTEMRFSPLSLFSKIRVQRTNGSGMILSLRRTISQRQLSPRGQEEEALTANSTFEAAKQLNAKQSGGISSTAASGNKTASDGSFNAVIVQQKRIDRYRTAAAMRRSVQLCAKSFFTQNHHRSPLLSFLRVWGYASSAFKILNSRFFVFGNNFIGNIRFGIPAHSRFCVQNKSVCTYIAENCGNIGPP